MSTTVRERRRFSPGGRLRVRPALLAGVILLVVVAGVVAAAYIDDQSHRDRLAPGIRIGGVDVGGLSVDAARARLVSRRGPAPPHAHRARRRPDLRAGAGPDQLSADLDVALERARADSRQGWIGSVSRTTSRAGDCDESLPLKLHYAPGVVPQLVDRVAAAVRRTPRDASVTPSAGGLTTTPSHTVAS